MLFAITQRFNDVRAVKDFITTRTNIEIVDNPIEPLPYRVRQDGELMRTNTSVRWYLRSDEVLRRVLRDGALGFGESHMDGDWQTDDIEQFCNELLKLEGAEGQLGWRAVPLLGSLLLGAVASRLLPRNTLQSARANVAHHYNISNDLYERMLGPSMMYSSGYFHKPGMSLEEAQRAKMVLLAKKLDLRPGLRVLEIGFGWGSMARFLADEYGVFVTALSLSEAQLDFARRRNGHPNVDFRLQDYRTMELEVEGQRYDRILSVEMIEHVGRKHLPTFFSKCEELLADDGIMALQSIGCSIWKVMVGKSFIERYIFPGCEPPQQTDFAQVANDWHLEDWQSFGKDYARTMRLWRSNLGTWEGLDQFDQRFQRMWEYYLLSCAASFDRRRTKVWQLVYTKTASKRPRDCHHIHEEKPGARAVLEGVYAV